LLARYLITKTAAGVLMVSYPAWTHDWAWGLPLIVMTVIMHILGLHFIHDKVKAVQQALEGRSNLRLLALAIACAAVCSVTILHGVESVIWAIAFLLIGALPDYDDAVLYSINAMTTLGQANMRLEKGWQLLGALEALDGMVLFGLTTAFLINVLEKVRYLFDGICPEKVVTVPTLRDVGGPSRSK
jgi:hypothetical protein